MVIVERGEIWWVNLPEPRGSEPGFARPVLIIQADSFNRSRIQTVLAITISSNLRLSHAPGNVSLDAASTGLPNASVANDSQIVTVDRTFLAELAGRVDERVLTQIEKGLRQVLNL